MCFTEFRSNSACPDEIIIVSLLCDLSAKSKAGAERSDLLLLLLFLSPYMKENSRKGCCSSHLVNKPVVKWFLQKCTYRNYRTCKVKFNFASYLTFTKLVGHKTPERANSCLLHCGQTIVK